MMGRITTWADAMRGGNTRPSSSLWIMIRPPMRRVVTPQDVVQAYSCSPLTLLKADLAGFGKILPEKMRRAGLQGFAVLHHRFQAIGRNSPGKALGGRFFAANDGHREIAMAKIADRARASACILLRLPGSSHGRYGLPAIKIRPCAKTSACASPSGRYSPIG